MPTDPLQTSCIVLAGGTGERLGGADKGLVDAAGKPMIEWLLSCIEPIADDIVISANRNADRYSGYGLVIEDELRYRDKGPLAGIASCLPHCRHRKVLVCCVDMPLIPTDLLNELINSLQDRLASICQLDGRSQLLMALHKETLSSLEHYLDGGQRAVMPWFETLDACAVNWQQQPPWLLNVNTQAELDHLSTLLDAM